MPVQSAPALYNWLTFRKRKVIQLEVINHHDGQKKLIAKLLYGTGMRLNEALSLRILDIDFEQKEIIVRHGKGDKDRHFMIPQKVISELKAHIEQVEKLHKKRSIRRLGSS